jgi:hypothetical protein
MRELISTLCRGWEIHLLWKPEPHEIPAYLAQGFVPIEMAEGEKSFVDFRCLDHHNGYAHLPSACVTALQHYDSLETRPVAKFMANHTDADCVLTGLTLTGLLPLSVLKRLNPEVGLLDTDPFGADISRMFYGDRILLWKGSMNADRQSGWSWLYGFQLFLDLFGEHDYYSYKEKIRQLREGERERKNCALEDYQKAILGPSGKILLVTSSRVAGFDVQFFRQAEFPVDSLQGWKHWCIAAYAQNAENAEKTRRVTLSCPNKRVAERIFGAGGLMNVYPKLPAIDGKGWGGREAVGGSPRGASFPESLLNAVLQTLEHSLLEG